VAALRHISRKSIGERQVAKAAIVLAFLRARSAANLAMSIWTSLIRRMLSMAVGGVMPALAVGHAEAKGSAGENAFGAALAVSALADARGMVMHSFNLGFWLASP
jgi:hypothetical protein